MEEGKDAADDAQAIANAEQAEADAAQDEADDAQDAADDGEQERESDAPSGLAGREESPDDDGIGRHDAALSKAERDGDDVKRSRP